MSGSLDYTFQMSTQFVVLGFDEALALVLSELKRQLPNDLLGGGPGIG